MLHDRREFLKSSAIASAVYVAGSSRAVAQSPNDTFHVACIGTGGRCRRLMPELANIDGVKIVGVCDIWDHHLEAGRKLADPKAFAVADFHELLDRKDVDGVLIGSPDHWHVPMTVAACQAGKDAYVEKPLTHDLSEGQRVVNAQNQSGQIVQVGMQQRSMPHIQAAYELAKSGHIGEIRKVHLTWNRNTERTQRRDYGIDPASVDWQRFLGEAPDQPFDEFKFRNWRWFWDFGGGIFTDLMVHWIDVAHWFLDLPMPQLAMSIGDHFQAAGVWETPDTVQTLLKYPEQGVQAYFEGTFFNARNRAMIEFMGSKGTIYIDRGRYEVHPDPHQPLEYSELVLGDGPRGADHYATPNSEFLHLKDWVDACRARRKPSAPAEAGVSAAAAAHLANRSLRSGQAARRESGDDA